LNGVSSLPGCDLLKLQAFGSCIWKAKKYGPLQMACCKFSSSTIATENLFLNSQTLLVCWRCCSPLTVYASGPHTRVRHYKKVCLETNATILIDKLFCIHNKELFSTALLHSISYLFMLSFRGQERCEGSSYL